jgi:cellulose synthase (UDP-forming)
VGYFDFTVVRPHLVVACLLAVGVIVGIVRAIGHDYFGSDPNVIALNVGWGLYSLIFLLAAIAVARETRQVRKTIRIDVNIPVLIHYASGIVSRSHTADLSMGGCRIAVPDDRHLQDDIEEIELILQSGAICIPAEQVTADERFIRLKFDENIPSLCAVNWCEWCWRAPMHGLTRRARRTTRSGHFSPSYAACLNCSG